MAPSSHLWTQLFMEGKWEACSRALRHVLNDLSLEENVEDSSRHARRIALNNNLFICDQLSQDWVTATDEDISQQWAKSYCVISEEYRFARCQHVCSTLPLDLILCVTCNLMWWSVMKVDAMHRHSCQKETLRAAIYSLKAVSESSGNWNPPHLGTEFVELEFIDAVDASIPSFVLLTPIQCQLTIEIIVLGLLSIFDANEISKEKPRVDFHKTVNNLVDILPQMKVHFSHAKKTESHKIGSLVKFGWKDVGEIVNEANIAVVSQALLTTVAILFLRDDSSLLKENSFKSLNYLSLIDNSSLMFPFLFHYLHAFAHFNSGNLDSTLYHLQHTSMCSSNFFMQGRSQTLRGQTLLQQDKGSAALQALQSIQYKRKEVQLPLCVFLMGKAYQKLGKFKQQIEVWDSLLDCLSAERGVQPSLLSPLAGMEHRLLLAAHSQPEICYEDVLKSSAMAHLSAQQPKEAAEKLLQLLHARSFAMDADLEDDLSLWKLSELLHDTISALLEASSTFDAEQICEAALQFHSSSRRLGSDEKAASDFSSLQEDVIALILLAKVRDSQESDDVSGILTRCIKLLQSLIDKLERSGESYNATSGLAKSLMAKVFLHKALLNARRKFENDAIACFQRALYWNGSDPEIILHFAHHLLNMSQHEESLALWRLYKDARKSNTKTDSIALNYLLGDQMDVDLKSEIICRLESLGTM